MAEKAVQRKTKDDEIDLTDLVHIIWKRKSLVIVGVVLVTLLSAGYSLVLPEMFESHGVYLLSAGESKTRIPQYKKFSAALLDEDRFLAFLPNYQNPLPPAVLDRIKKRMKSENSLEKCIQPLYAYTVKDLKEIGRSSKDQENYIIGLRLRYSFDKPRMAQQIVFLLGDYIRFTLVKEMVSDFVKSEYRRLKVALNTNENDLLESRFDLLQNQRKRELLKDIKRDYPQADSALSRQVVSVDKGGSRYLSPTLQLVGIDSIISELKIEISKLERESEKLNLEYGFFNETLSKIKNNNIGGHDLLEELVKQKRQYFEDKDLSKDTVQQVLNTIAIKLEDLLQYFNDVFDFVPKPNRPQRRSSPNRKVIVLAGFFLSLFVFVFIAFFVEWWKSNKSKIVTKKG